MVRGRVGGREKEEAEATLNERAAVYMLPLLAIVGLPGTPPSMSEASMT